MHLKFMIYSNCDNSNNWKCLVKKKTIFSVFLANACVLNNLNTRTPLWIELLWFWRRRPSFWNYIIKKKHRSICNILLHSLFHTISSFFSKTKCTQTYRWPIEDEEEGYLHNFHLFPLITRLIIITRINPLSFVSFK